MNGEGEFEFKNGDVFRGRFVNNTRQGAGQFIDRSSQNVLKAGYENGKKNGRAVLMMSDGSTEEGNYANDLKDGQWTLRKEGKMVQNVFRNGNIVS